MYKTVLAATAMRSGDSLASKAAHHPRHGSRFRLLRHFGAGGASLGLPIGGGSTPYNARMIAIRAKGQRRVSIFKEHPRRAGNKIWGKERVAPAFSESNNCKDPRMG